MKTVQVLLISLSAAFGCGREQRDTTPMSSERMTTSQIQERRELNRDRQELIVIGQVIGTQSERVVQALEKADIDCMVQGDEFHDISVPMHRRQEAVGIVAKDAQQGGYEIIWKTQ